MSIDLIEEIKNLEDIAQYLKPGAGDRPEIPGIDIQGLSIPFSGSVGGDHIIYVDFKKRYDLEARIADAQEKGLDQMVASLRNCQTKAGIALADVAGHRVTDALLAMMLHQAFLVGAIYELDIHGRITTRLIENLNRRFYQSSAVNKYLTLLYGEIAEGGRFRFISAGHPPPIVFSSEYDQFVCISDDRLATFPPLGTIPPGDDIDSRKTEVSPLGLKEGYSVNEIDLMGSGDILMLYTDGLSEHENSESVYFPDALEGCLRKVKDRSVSEICEAIRTDVLQFGDPLDDLSYILIKRN